MLKTTIAVALAAIALPVVTLPALAGEVRTATPIEATALTTDDLQMVAYFVPAGDDRYEVTATWLDADDDDARRLVLSLDDGDRVSFALPGNEDTVFTFAREIDAVTISSKPAGGAFRNASL